MTIVTKLSSCSKNPLPEELLPCAKGETLIHDFKAQTLPFPRLRRRLIRERTSSEGVITLKQVSSPKKSRIRSTRFPNKRRALAAKHYGELR